MHGSPGEEECAKRLKYESQEKSHLKADCARSNGSAPRVGRVIGSHCKGEDKAKDDGKGVEDVGKVILEGPFQLPQRIGRTELQ